MPEILEQAHQRLDEIHKHREDKPAPLTSENHLDDWLHETDGYIEAELIRGNAGKAKAIADYYMDAQTVDGRLPHMIINTNHWRRNVLDKRVQHAKKQPNGYVVTPFTGVSVMALNVERIAEALPPDEAEEWAVQRAIPVLIKEKAWRYGERDVYNDGLPVQIHPDELRFRASSITGQVISTMEPGKLMTLQERTKGIKPVQRAVRSFRIAQGDDLRGQDGSTYDPEQFMALETAAGVYTALAVAKSHDYQAWNVKKAVDSGQEKSAFMVQDVAHTVALINDNEALMRLCEKYGYEIPTELAEKMHQTKENVELHWDEDSRSYVGRLPHRKQILAQVGGPESLLVATLDRATIKQSRHDQAVSAIAERADATKYSLTTNHGVLYESDQIDRGAVDISLNAAIVRGLDKTGHNELAGKIRAASLQLVEDAQAFSRAYDAETGEPKGQSKWGPTAAAVIALARK